MKVALFIPCFIDAFHPEVGIATLELLERFGIEVDYPEEQTCCGQPMANSGAQADAAGAERVFARNFAGYDHIVGPSASCVHHIREHLTAIEQTDPVRKVRANAWELVEFLHDVVGAREFPWAEFPYRVGLHNSCSALRHRREGSTTEIRRNAFLQTTHPASGRQGHRVREARAPDECCGFGGTFSVTEEPVSVRMGQDKGRDHLNAGAQYIVSGDMSCLMHQQGCAERMKADARFIHIAQVLNGARE